MRISASIETSKIEASLGALSKMVDSSDYKRAIEGAAEIATSLGQKRAPRGFGNLANSDFVEKAKVERSRGIISVRFGFSSRHASIMDSGWKTKVIRPKKAKRLFIPISERAKRIGSTSGASRRLLGSTGRGGLAYGKDFVLAKKVVTPAPREGGHVGRDGERKGPNFYFSGAVKKLVNSRKFERHMAIAIRGMIRTRARRSR